MNPDDQEYLDQQAALELQKASLRGSSDIDHEDRARLLETVLKSDLEASTPALKNLASRDLALANFEEGVGKIEAKWMAEIADLMIKAEYPHPDSGLQGLARAWATGDPTDRKTSLDLSQAAMDEIFKIGSFSRMTRGEEGFQQEISSKQVTETHAVREDGGSKSGGGILGRFRS